MKSVHLILFYISVAFSMLKLKLGSCGVYEERIGVSTLNLDETHFNIDLSEISIQNSKRIKLKPFKLDLKKGLIYAMCDFENFQSLFSTSDEEQDSVRKICKDYNLFIEGQKSGAIFRSKFDVITVESTGNVMTLQSNNTNFSFVGEHQKVMSDFIALLDSFLTNSGDNPCFTKLKEQYDMRFDDNFVYCVKMIKRCAEDFNFQNIGFNEGIKKLNEIWLTDKGRRNTPSASSDSSEATFFKFVDSLEFEFFFNRMEQIFARIIKSQDFPYFKVAFISNPDDNKIRIHRSLSIEIESGGKGFKDCNFVLYDSKQKAVSEKLINWFIFKDKACILFDDLIKNDVLYVKAFANDKSEGSSLLKLTPFLSK